MNRPMTRILEATPSGLVAAGFAISIGLHIAPVTFHRSLDEVSFWWTSALCLLALAAAVFSMLNQTRRVLQVSSVLKLALGIWVVAVGAAILARPPELPDLRHWLLTREWTLVGAVWALGVYFINAWWVVVHFRLPALEGQVELRRQLNQVRHEREPGEEGP